MSTLSWYTLPLPRGENARESTYISYPENIQNDVEILEACRRITPSPWKPIIVSGTPPNAPLSFDLQSMGKSFIIWRGVQNATHASMVFSKRTNTTHRMAFLISRYHANLSRERKGSCLRDGTDDVLRNICISHTIDLEGRLRRIWNNARQLDMSYKHSSSCTRLEIPAASTCRGVVDIGFQALVAGPTSNDINGRSLHRASLLYGITRVTEGITG
ncbi:hypothetical protein EI94DRAFT_1884381 [Lactarius quietus]|nr:hypothetical protein EI94DRAFT_1884381 [Lactarius quietus]